LSIRLDDDLADRLFAIAETLTLGAMQNGTILAGKHGVASLTIKDGKIEARVEGRRGLCRTILDLSDPDDADFSCSCTRWESCEHIAAVIVTILYGIATYGPPEAPGFEEYVDLFPPDWLRGKNLPPQSLFSAFDSLGGEPPKERPEPTEPPAKVAEEWWREYLRLTDREDRAEFLFQVTNARLRLRRGEDWMLRDTVRRVTGADNPLDDLHAYAAVMKNLHHYVYTNVRQFDDSGFLAFLASPEAAEVDRRFKAESDERHLCQWLEHAPAPPRRQITGPAVPDHLEAVWFVAPDSEGLPQLSWQLLLTSKRLDRAPRAHQGIDQLERDCESGKRVFPGEERSLLGFVATLPGLPSSSEDSEGRPKDPTVFPVLAATRWLDRWGGQPVLRWRDSGGIVLADWRPARLAPRADAEGRLAWHVELPPEEPEAPPRIGPLAEAELAVQTSWGHPSEEAAAAFVRRGDALHPLDTGGMPRSVLVAAWRQPLLPVQRLRNSVVAAARLVDRYSRTGDVQETWGGLVRTVRVEPAVELRLRGERTIELAAYVDAADGARFTRDARGRWIELPRSENSVPSAAAEAESAASGDSLEAMNAWEEAQEAERPADEAPDASRPDAEVLCTVPSPDDTDPLERFLAAFVPKGAEPFGGLRGEWGRTWAFAGKQLSALAQAWAERPGGVRYLGNSAFRDLLMLRKPPRFSISITEGGVDWFSVSVEMEKEMAALSPGEVRQALSATQSRLITLSGGRMYKREDLEEFEKTWEAMSGLGLNPAGDHQRIHALQLALGGEDVLSGLEGMEDLGARIRETLDGFQGIPAAAIPPELVPVLRPYQRQGVDFLVWAWEHFGGAILADDMGLGKTLQVLAALSVQIRARQEKTPSLVICPTSVTHGWLREAAHFTPWLKTAILQRGPDRKELWEKCSDYDLVITNYALARIDSKHLARHKWRLICVDEAQAIKNPAADIARAVKSFDAEYRVALTGTPIENRLLDLWSIADFAAPGYLGTHRTFERRTKEDTPESVYRGLRARLRPLLVRRMKKEVATELPPRIEERRDCEMLPAQRKAYLAELKRTRDMLAGAKSAGVVGQERIQILAALTRMRQICCDPALIGLDTEGSGKVNATLDIVDELLEAGHKVLLFSQFVRMLERIEQRFQKSGTPYWKLTGQSVRRHEIVEAFETSPTPGVFLISLKAGGTGLNLVSASHVILFDPWWNPAVEAQAIDRTHRIGQDKTVIAYRMVMTDTIEERILELQEKKRGLVQNVLEEDAFNRMLTRDDLSFILEEPE
jgi:superfamily II DNA or RNA helicase